MSAIPARARGADRPAAGTHAAAGWAQIGQVAPALAVTMRRYLAQAATFLAPRSVAAANGALRQLARWILASTSIESVTEIRRDDIEDFKVWLSAQQGTNGSLPASTYGQRLRMLRVFSGRIIEWDWPDAPPRNPSSAVTSRPAPTRCPGSWTTATRPGSWQPPGPAPTPATAWSSNCSPAPACAPANPPISKPTPSSSSARPTGCGSRSASSATTATCRCIPSWSRSWPHGPPPTPITSAPAAAWPPITAAP
jgi:hypothetical protein